MKKVLILLLLFFAPLASACRVENISTSERIEQAKEVYFGYVTAIHFESFEKQQEKNGLFSENYLLIGSDLKKYRIIVKETFKGKSSKFKEVEIQWCGGGEAELGSRVVVYTSSYASYIEPLTEELYKSIKSGTF